MKHNHVVIRDIYVSFVDRRKTSTKLFKNSEFKFINLIISPMLRPGQAPFLFAEAATLSTCDKFIKLLRRCLYIIVNRQRVTIRATSLQCLEACDQQQYSCSFDERASQTQPLQILELTINSTHILYPTLKVSKFILVKFEILG